MGLIILSRTGLSDEERWRDRREPAFTGGGGRWSFMRTDPGAQKKVLLVKSKEKVIPSLSVAFPCFPKWAAGLWTPMRPECAGRLRIPRVQVQRRLLWLLTH